MFTIHHEIDTSFNADKITIRNRCIDTDGIVKRHYTEIIDLKDRAVRDALIALGWTPPKEDK